MQRPNGADEDCFVQGRLHQALVENEDQDALQHGDEGMKEVVSLDVFQFAFERELHQSHHAASRRYADEVKFGTAAVVVCSVIS